MAFGQTVLLVYAALMLAGGVMGWRAAGSRASLIAGIASAAALAASWLVSRSQPAAGYWMGAAIAAALSVVFVMRLVKTGKLMPSGGTLLVSLISLGLLAWSALDR